MRNPIRAHITSFRGIAVSGDHARQPMMPVTDFEWICSLRDARNLWAVPGGVLTTREAGRTKQADAPEDGGKWDGLSYIVRPDGARSLCGIANGRLFDQQGLGGTWTEVASGLPVGERWTFAAWHDQLFMACPGHRPLRYTDGHLFNLLIDPPETAVSGTGEGTGTMEGDYIYAVTFYREADGWESPAGPDSQVISVSGVDHVHLTGIPSSTDPQVDKVRIYRTTNGGVTPLLLATVDNGTTEYDDSKRDTQLGEKCPTLGSFAPSGERIWVSGDRVYMGAIRDGSERHGGRVRWCKNGQPWNWDALDFTDEVNGEFICGVRIPEGSLLLTRDQAWLLLVQQGALHEVRGTGVPGVVGPWAACEIPGGAAWLTSSGVYMRIGGKIDHVSTNVDPILRDIPPESIDLCWLAWHHGWRALVVGFSLTAGSTPDSVLVFHPESKSWWRMDWGGVVATPAGSGRNQLDRLAIGNEDGTVSWGLRGDASSGAMLRIGPADMGMAFRKRFRRVAANLVLGADHEIVLTTTVDENIRSSSSWSLQSGGATLSVDFELDTSYLVGDRLEKVTSRIGETGHLITFEFTQKNVAPIDVRAMDVMFQIPARD